MAVEVEAVTLGTLDTNSVPRFYLKAIDGEGGLL